MQLQALVIIYNVMLLNDDEINIKYISFLRYLCTNKCLNHKSIELVYYSEEILF